MNQSNSKDANFCVSIPPLRFPGFSGEWERNKLGEIAKFSKGKGISKINISEDGETECIRYGQLYTHYREVINEVISKTNIDIKDLILSEANDVIIPASGETQIDIATASCVLKSGIALGGDLNIIKTKNNGVFLSYYLNNRKKLDIANLAQGISVVHLYSSQLALLDLNLPSLPEQQKIATFLTSVESKINQLKKKKTLLEQYKKGVMQKIFTKVIRFKDEKRKEFPVWEEKRLGEVCDYKNGGSFENFISENGNYYLITLNSIDINGKLKTEHKRVDKTDNSLNKGDLIMVLSDVAHGYFLGLTDIIPSNDYVLNQRMGALRPKIKVNTFYLKTFINHNQTYFKLMGQGSSQQNLSKGDIQNFEIHLPCLFEQTKIANFLSAIDDKINHCSKQIEKTEQWKKGLLQKMFC